MRSGVVIAATLTLLVSMTAPTRADETEAPTTDLNALTQAARANFPGLRAAIHNIRAAEARLGEARVAPFFQLNVTGAFTMAPEQRGHPLFSPDDQLPLGNPWRPVVAVGVEGAIPLYTFGKIRAARSAARAGIAAAEQEEHQVLARLLYDTRRAYYALQTALDVQQMIHEGEEKLERASEILAAKIEDEDPDVNPMDQYRLETTLAEVRARKSDALQLEATARDALQTLSGVERVRVPDCPLQAISLELAPVEHYVSLATHARPELAMIDAGLRAREADLKLQRARYFPDLALALRASHSRGPGITDQTNPFITDKANATELGAALVTRWSLDLWGNSYRVDRANQDLLESQALSAQARSGVELEVRTVYAQVSGAAERQRAWSEGHRQGRSWFVAAAQAYEVGAVEPKELIDAVRAYFTNRFSHLESIRDWNTGLANLERVSGEALRPQDSWEISCE